MKIILFALVAAFWQLQAQNISFDSTSQVDTLEANGVSVPIYEKATLSISAEEKYDLTLTGAGIRKKKIFLFNEEIYIATSYVHDTSLISPQTAANDIRHSPVKAMQLVTTRYLSAGQIRTSFEDALEHNGIDLNRPAVKKILEQITEGLPEGSAATFVGLHTPDGQSFSISSPFISASESDATMSDDFWSAWFGLPLDNFAAQLQQKLIERVTGR